MPPQANTTNVRELIAWDLDPYTYRDTAITPQQLSAARTRAQANIPTHNTSLSALLEPESAAIQPFLNSLIDREDFQQEFRTLNHSLGVVDLRHLIAFQRRLILDPTRTAPITIQPTDWPALFALATTPRNPAHEVIDHTTAADRTTVHLQSTNPDLSLHIGPKGASIQGGSPFFEVAFYRDRWFLRDGYHRAYHLLRAGITSVPAIVIHARTLDEVGATGPWFFGEDILFSPRPSLVSDFLHDDLTLTYPRVRLVKTLRIHIEESLEPLP